MGKPKKYCILFINELGPSRAAVELLKTHHIRFTQALVSQDSKRFPASKLPFLITNKGECYGFKAIQRVVKDLEALRRIERLIRKSQNSTEGRPVKTADLRVVDLYVDTPSKPCREAYKILEEAGFHVRMTPVEGCWDPVLRTGIGPFDEYYGVSGVREFVQKEKKLPIKLRFGTPKVMVVEQVGNQGR